MGWVCRGQGLRESAYEVQCTIAGGPGALPQPPGRVSSFMPAIIRTFTQGPGWRYPPCQRTGEKLQQPRLAARKKKKSKRSGRVRRLNSRQLCSVSPIECRAHEKGYSYCTYIQPPTTGCTLITRCFISGGYKFFVLPCFTAVPK